MVTYLCSDGGKMTLKDKVKKAPGCFVTSVVLLTWAGFAAKMFFNTLDKIGAFHRAPSVEVGKPVTPHLAYGVDCNELYNQPVRSCFLDDVEHGKTNVWRNLFTEPVERPMAIQSSHCSMLLS